MLLFQNTLLVYMMDTFMTAHIHGLVIDTFPEKAALSQIPVPYSELAQLSEPYHPALASLYSRHALTKPPFKFPFT